MMMAEYTRERECQMVHLESTEQIYEVVRDDNVSVTTKLGVDTLQRPSHG